MGQSEFALCELEKMYAKWTTPNIHAESQRDYNLYEKERKNIVASLILLQYWLL